MARTVEVQLGAALAGQAGAVEDRTAVRRLMERAARAALRGRAVSDAEVSITLLDDAEISAMNEQFLAHDGPTDVISFTLYGEDEAPVGDVYVGYEQARRQAAAAGVPLTEELARLAVHGTLHVLGFDHPDGEERVESAMWRLQEEILAKVLPC